MNGVLILGTVIMKMHQPMVQSGKKGEIIVQEYCVAVLGAVIRGIVALPVAASVPLSLGTTLSVFGLSVPSEGLFSHLPSYSLALFFLIFFMLPL